MRLRVETFRALTPSRPGIKRAGRHCWTLNGGRLVVMVWMVMGRTVPGRIDAWGEEW